MEGRLVTSNLSSLQSVPQGKKVQTLTLSQIGKGGEGVGCVAFFVPGVDAEKQVSEQTDRMFEKKGTALFNNEVPSCDVLTFILLEQRTFQVERKDNSMIIS